MPTLSTHVLDAGGGGARAGVPLRLERGDGGMVAAATTGADGRAALGATLPTGTYRLSWELAGAFLEEVSVLLHLVDERHYHVPLLATPASAVAYLGV